MGGARAILVILILAPAVAAAGPAIRVPAKAEVAGPVVRLGDVARLAGFARAEADRLTAVEIGRAPAVGVGQLLPRAYLESVLRDAGVGPGVRLALPDRLEVVRKAETLAGAALRRRVEAAVRARMPHAAEDVAAVQVPELPDLKVPLGSAVAVEFEEGEDFAGPVTVELRVTDGGELVRAQRVTARVDVFATVWVPTRAFRRGEPLTPRDLVEKRVPQSDVPRDALDAAALGEGARLRRDLAAGQPLRRAWVDLPPMVARGDRVTLVATRGALRLTAVGEAMGRGSFGDTVKVRNVSSSKVVAGRVAGPQLVEVPF